MRTNIFNIVFILSVFGATLTQKSTAQDYNKKFTTVNTTIKKDSIVTPKDTIERSTVPVKDTLKSPKKAQDTLAPKTKPLLEGLVFRKAKDYEALNLAKKEITLYNEAEIRYQDYELTAGKIIFNYEKNEIYAGGIKDSVGNMSQYPCLLYTSRCV